MLFVAAMTLVAIVVAICCLTPASARAPQEEKKWAMSIISGAMSGLVGYLVRK